MNKKNFLLIFLSIFYCTFFSTHATENTNKQKITEEIIYKQLLHIHTNQKINIKTIQPILNTYKQYTVTQLYDIIKARRDELSSTMSKLEIKDGVMYALGCGLIGGLTGTAITLMAISALQVLDNTINKKIFYKRITGSLVTIIGCKLLFNALISTAIKLLRLKFSIIYEKNTLDQILRKLKNIILLERIKEAQGIE